MRPEDMQRLADALRACDPADLNFVRAVAREASQDESVSPLTRSVFAALGTLVLAEDLARIHDDDDLARLAEDTAVVDDWTGPTRLVAGTSETVLLNPDQPGEPITDPAGDDAPNR